MSQTLNCGDIAARELIERYQHGSLQGEELDAFEAHLLTCADCQRELRLASAVRDLLAPDATTSPVPGRAFQRRRAFLVGSALAAAVVVLLLVRGSNQRTELRDLARIDEPPIYLGLAVRTTGAERDSLFDAAMRLYDERRFAQAIDQLDQAFAAGADAAPVHFFRGSSELMLDRWRAAAESFARVIALGPTAYRAEAQLYRARALLGLGQGDAALAQLAEMQDAPPEIERVARVLADTLKVRLQR